MTEPDSPEQQAAADSSQRRSLQALRDRTDELELIISSLTIFALFSLPGWLFENFANSYTHLSVALIAGSNMGIAIITGLCYVLGSCFVLHLLVRAYWVGLIGLRTVFPQGINWSRTPGIGPLTRERYRRSLPDLEQSIDRSDRMASSLFAVISLITLAVLWIAVLLVLVLGTAGQIGARFGMTNRFIFNAAITLVVIVTGLPAMIWLLDAVLGARWPGLQRRTSFQFIIRQLHRCAGWIYPQRLILPVQLTLQSNTRPRMFPVLLFLGAVAIVVIGNFRIAGWTSFTLSGEFRYLGDEALRQHFRSAHYENLRTDKDKFSAWPMIPAFEQSGTMVPLFLPYQPLRDNLLLEQLCAQAPNVPGSADCLKLLWRVRLNDRVIELNSFRPAERGDLRLRGLIGLVPLSGLAPGMQELVVTWNPAGFAENQPVDDRYQNLNSDFHIPFAFSPGYEMALAEEVPVASQAASQAD
ncbi:MAG: hypothetical protein KKC01_01995 [Gammaproteobacteria bacterium]|nr:hypothetical protein [Gammaproteobacteria bacterium]